MTTPNPRTALLIHAYPLSGAMWEQQESALQEAGFRVIAPHLPGFGGSSGEMSSLPDTARDLLALLQELAGDDQVALVGLSMGGYLALELLAQAPERFSQVVLADTSARADDGDKRKDRLSQAQRVLTESRQFIIDAAEEEHSPRTFERVKPMIEAASREGIAAALKAMAERPDHRDTLKTLKLPLLVIVGADDEITPPCVAQEIADLGHGELKIIPEAGHLSNLDQPQEFSEVLLDFLKKGSN